MKRCGVNCEKEYAEEMICLGNAGTVKRLK